MHRLLIIAGVVGWVALCLAPWFAMEPNAWRIPAAIGLVPFAIPFVLFAWFGEWERSKSVLRSFMPSFVTRAWDQS
jgi:F0F1-type ATP synthase assembly protein I